MCGEGEGKQGEGNMGVQEKNTRMREKNRGNMGMVGEHEEGEYGNGGEEHGKEEEYGCGEEEHGKWGYGGGEEEHKEGKYGGGDAEHEEGEHRERGTCGWGRGTERR